MGAILGSLVPQLVFWDGQIPLPAEDGKSSSVDDAAALDAYSRV